MCIYIYIYIHIHTYIHNISLDSSSQDDQLLEAVVQHALPPRGVPGRPFLIDSNIDVINIHIIINVIVFVISFFFWLAGEGFGNRATSEADGRVPGASSWNLGIV